MIGSMTRHAHRGGPGWFARAALDMRTAWWIGRRLWRLRFHEPMAGRPRRRRRWAGPPRRQSQTQRSSC